MTDYQFKSVIRMVLNNAVETRDIDKQIKFLYELLDPEDGDMGTKGLKKKSDKKDGE